MLSERPIFNCFQQNTLADGNPYELEEKNLFFEQNEIFQNQRVKNDTLIQFHKIYGNKWKQISKHLPNTSDSFIKNMFYTLARKALRKVNFYIESNSKTKGKKSKTFKLNFVFKLANLAESERITEYRENMDLLKGFYTKLLYSLLDIGNIEINQLKGLFQTETLTFDEKILKHTIEGLIQNLRIIEKIFIEQNLIKKGRTKKKFPKKGLIQKALSSNAFKESFEEFDTSISLSLLIPHPKQHNQDSQITIFGQENLSFVCELEAVPENIETNKDELDNCLEIKTFDPILFQ